MTPDTILEFDFESTQQGELHGIGFDTDDAISPDLSFIVYGTQSWGIPSEGSYSGSGQQHFVIPVGSYFTGEMQWLTLINDHDVSNPTGESQFRNVRVYEAGAETGGEGSTLVYLHTDHLGTVVKATDEAQNVVWDAVRKPFGERTVAVAEVAVLLGFPGQYFDEETNNYYNYFRDYDPTTGRYLQSDPIGLWGGFNTYAYVGGNPLYWVDSDGLNAAAAWEFGWGVGIAVARSPWGRRAILWGMDAVWDAMHNEVTETKEEIKRIKKELEKCKSPAETKRLKAELKRLQTKLRELLKRNRKSTNPHTDGISSPSRGRR
ncbi:MAG: RHS repeat-associated core domain-containing protein [Candidatus Thiodiazotropha sp.]